MSSREKSMKMQHQRSGWATLPPMPLPSAVGWNRPSLPSPAATWGYWAQLWSAVWSWLLSGGVELLGPPSPERAKEQSCQGPGRAGGGPPAASTSFRECPSPGCSLLAPASFFLICACSSSDPSFFFWTVQVSPQTQGI